jgi:hypothetical protein
MMSALHCLSYLAGTLAFLFVLLSLGELSSSLLFTRLDDSPLSFFPQPVDYCTLQRSSRSTLVLQRSSVSEQFT